MQEFKADLHIHSRYSRATSSRLAPALLAAWAGIKGLSLLGSGDFTHPVWLAELEEALAPHENSGLYRLKDQKAAENALPEWKGRIPGQPPLFMLQGEISSIYKQDGQVRKVHNLVFMPNFDAAKNFCRKLGELGNLKSDGRPILGLSARNLLELVLEAHPQAFLIPAHIWTPWFSLFGSKSGFNRLEDCFGDLSEHIFALETGLSSDPAMNRMVSALDKYRMVSNSDAHSGENLGREANLFSGELSYSGVLQALRGQGAGQNGQTRFLGTLEFFPDEGKYHLDGHRACNVALTPEETRALNGLCPVCGKALTIGVLSRVHDLADRDAPVFQPGESFHSLIPLPELLGEIFNCGPKTRKVAEAYDKLVQLHGPELQILTQTPEDDLARFYPPLGEGIGRMRRGQVRCQGGYDGEYGVIRVFSDAERKEFLHGAALLKTPEPQTAELALLEGLKKNKKNHHAGTVEGSAGSASGPDSAAGNTPAPIKKRKARTAKKTDEEPSDPAEAASHAAAGNPENANGPIKSETEEADDFAFSTLEGAPVAYSPGALDPAQEAAIGSGPENAEYPTLVLAGPGSGKTRTLVAKIESLLKAGVNPNKILALTFTRRAALEMDQRLNAALGPGAFLPRTDTLHALALEQWLRLSGENPVLLAEENAFQVFAEANPEQGRATLRDHWKTLNLCRERLALLPPELAPLNSRYTLQKNAWNLLDYTDLLEFWLEQTRSGKFVRPWDFVLVDEIQDLSLLQLTLVKNLLPPDGRGFFGIGDPDQSIYGFRGAFGDVEPFLRRQWPALRSLRLKLNYRSAPQIVRLADQTLHGPDAPEPMLPAPLACASPGEIKLFDAPSAEAEGAWIAGEILRLMGSGSHTLDDAMRKADSGKAGPGQNSGQSVLAGQSFSPGDFAVLLRTRSLILPIQRALHRAGIPYSVPLADAFWADPLVQRILNAARRMLGIGGQPVQPEEYQLGVNPILKDRLAPDVNPERFSREQADDEPGMECPETVMLRGPIAIAAYMENRPPFNAGFWKGPAFTGLIKAHDRHRGWKGLLNWISLQNELELVRAKSEKVQIMTLHASKGLEFPIIFMPALEDGLLPFMGAGLLSGRADQAPPSPLDMAEELRLFYVGLTRAQKGLYLSRAIKRMLFGHEQRLTPSRFLSRLPQEDLKRSCLKAVHRKVETQLSLI